MTSKRRARRMRGKERAEYYEHVRLGLEYGPETVRLISIPWPELQALSAKKARRREQRKKAQGGQGDRYFSTGR